MLLSKTWESCKGRQGLDCTDTMPLACTLPFSALIQQVSHTVVEPLSRRLKTLLLSPLISPLNPHSIASEVVQGSG